MTPQEEPRDAHPEQEAHGATPPHGDPLTDAHPETGGPHEADPPAPEGEEDSATPPHGDPLR